MDFSNNRIDTQRRTAVYVRISTSMQKTDRQVEELVTFAKENKLNFNEKKDIYRDVISGFKDGEQRPMFSALMEKVRRESISNCFSASSAVLTVSRQTCSARSKRSKNRTSIAGSTNRASGSRTKMTSVRR